MKKIVLFTIAMVLMACSGKTEKTDQETTESATEEKVTAEATKSPTEDLEQLVTKFLKENPYYMLENENAVNDWYDKLYKLLGEKPEFAETLSLTKILREYINKRSEAFEKWDKEVGASREDEWWISYGYEHQPLAREYEENFIKLVHDNPTLIDYPEALLETIAGYRSLTSADHKLRIYYWMTSRGGETNHNTCKFYQFRTEDGKVNVPMYSKLTWAKATPAMKDDDKHPLNAESPWEWSTWPDTLYTLDTDKGRVYMEKATREPYNLYILEELTAKSISGDQLTDYPLFEAKGKKSSKIESAAGCIAEDETPSNEGLENGIKYDEKSGTINVDLYKEREKFDQDRGWFIKTGTDTYVFDGKVFKKD